MIRPNDAETIRGIYRIKRLLCSHDAAVEATIKLCACFSVDRDEILLITQGEDERRHELIRTMDAAMRKLAQ